MFLKDFFKNSIKNFWEERKSIKIDYYIKDKRYVNFLWWKINLMKRKNLFDRMDKKIKFICIYKVNLIFVKFFEWFKCYFFFCILN